MYNRVKKFISKSIIIEREGEYPTPVSLTGVITFVIFVTVVGLCSKIINIPANFSPNTEGSQLTGFAIKLS